MNSVKVHNPYLDVYNTFPKSWRSNADIRYQQRIDLCSKYAWAIPDQQALEMIAKYSPVVEIGAGTGYWAYLLNSLGVDIVAYDIHPADGSDDNEYHSGDMAWWPQIVVGDSTDLIKHANRALFLCWPPYSEPMASDCLKAYEGDILIYVGEDEGGCTADKEFFELLDMGWDEIEQHYIPQWDGMHDRLVIYRRK